MFDNAEPVPPVGRPGLLAEFHLALAFLTRLPLPPLGVLPAGSLARAMRVFPLVGVVVGAIGAVAFALAHMLLPAALAGLIALTVTIAITGALHEDGLADIADGFGGGADKAAKLAIMKDSRIGTFGVVAVALALLLRAGALASLAGPSLVAGALVAAHALARAAIPAVLQALPPARTDGLGANAGRPTAADAGMAVTLALVIAAVALPVQTALAAALGAAIGALAVAILAWRQIGGQTGDVLGAVEQAAETLALLAAVAAT